MSEPEVTIADVVPVTSTVAPDVQPASTAEPILITVDVPVAVAPAVVAPVTITVAAPAVVAPQSVTFTSLYGYWDEANVLREWREGQVVTDLEQILDLKARGAPIK